MCSMIKLTNGETLLAKVIQKDEDHICINDPIQLEMIPTDQGNSLTTLSWIPLLNPTNMVALKNMHVLLVYDVEDSMGLYYRKCVAMLKNDVVELKKIVEEIKRQQQSLASIAGVDEAAENGKIINKLKLIRSQTSNTVH
jgi:hypothetical protein